MKVSGVIQSLSSLGKLKCSGCGKYLIIEADGYTIIKNKLLKIHKGEGRLQIKCGGCGEINTVIASN
jgi:phage FluMu protein Com